MMGEMMRSTADVDVLKADWNGLRWFGAKLGRATLRFWRVEGNGPYPPAIHVCLAHERLRRDARSLPPYVVGGVDATEKVRRALAASARKLRA